MSFYFRPFEITDTDLVWADLSDVSTKEAAAVEETSATLSAVLATNKSALTGVLDGKVVVVWWTETVNGDTFTGLLTSNAFFNNFHKTARVCRRELNRLAHRHEGSPIRAVSMSSHPRLVRWFRTLGFELVSTHDTAKVFEYFPIR